MLQLRFGLHASLSTNQMCVSNRLSLLSHVTRGFSDLAPTNLLCFAVLDQNVNVSSIDDDDLEEEEVADVRARARWKSLRRSVRRWVLLLNADASPALTVASLWTRTGARSCTNEGQVQVPCEDQLALEGSEKFLITLFGHACYDVQLVADVPLDVYFYEAHGSFYAWRLRELDTDLGLPRSGEDGVQPSGGAPSTAANSRNGSTTTNATTGVAPLVGQVKNAHLCTQSRDCHRTLLGLARHGVYNLVVAYSNAGTAVSNDGILLRLVDCDSSSLSHILGTSGVGLFLAQIATIDV